MEIVFRSGFQERREGRLSANPVAGHHHPEKAPWHARVILKIIHPLRLAASLQQFGRFR